MNKYISSTLRSISCLLETVWAGLTGVVFGQAIGFVTHVVTLAKYINHAIDHALFTIRPHNTQYYLNEGRSAPRDFYIPTTGALGFFYLNFDIRHLAPILANESTV